MKKSTLEKTVLVLTICLIVLLLAVFLISRKKPTTPLPDYGEIVQFDPSREGGHLLPGLNMLMQGERTGQSVKIITNAKGFRNDREFSYEVPDHVYRILFLGDSYVDGMRTDQKNTIGFVLEKLLNTAIKNNIDSVYHSVEVMISGHNNPANAWYYYQEHGYKYNPNLVVVGITLGNDITWHGYRSGVLPITGNDGVVSLKLASDAQQTGTGSIDLLLPSDAYTSQSIIWEQIENIEFRIRKLLAGKFYLFGYCIPPQLSPKINDRHHVYGAGFSVSMGLFYRPTMPEIEKMYIDFENVLAGINNRVKTNGSDTLFVLFPTRMQIIKEDWELLTRFYSLDKTRFDLNYPNQRMSRICKEQDLLCLDLILPFKLHYEKEKTHLYRPRGDMHLNETGQKLAAGLLSNHIQTLIRRGQLKRDAEKKILDLR